MSPNVGVDAVTCDDFFTKLAWERCSFSVFLPIFIQLSLKGLLSLSWNGLFATIKKVKFHDVSLVAYKSDELSLIVTKIGTLMMLDSYTSSMCLVTWDRSTYARILIEIDVCNGFSDNLVIAVPNLDRPGYTKETILVKYEWKPPHCSTCLIFGHSVDDCQKAQKLVVNKAGQSSTLLVYKINMFKQQLPEGKCVLLDDEGKPLKNIDYTGDHDNEDEVEPVDNEMANILASKVSHPQTGPGRNTCPRARRHHISNTRHERTTTNGRFENHNSLHCLKNR
ncbi:RNA-directed DNA polymerase, eukaryota, reverse transcriptase zinc-binding domain protein [Tanacetum coccineum]